MRTPHQTSRGFVPVAGILLITLAVLGAAFIIRSQYPGLLNLKIGVQTEEEGESWFGTQEHLEYSLIMSDFSAYENIKEYKPTIRSSPHECFEGDNLVEAAEYIQVQVDLSKQNRVVKTLCSSEQTSADGSSFKSIIVKSIDKLSGGQQYPQFTLDAYTIYPKDQKDIPTQVQRIYKSGNNRQQVFRLAGWLSDDTAFYTIFDLSRSFAKTYVYNPGSSWDKKSGVNPFFVEYCRFIKGTPICKTTNEETESLFFDNPEWQSIFGF